MPFFKSPTSFRVASLNSAPQMVNFVAAASPSGIQVFGKAKTHSSHPAFGHLILLVFEAVLEVVCVSLPGYIVARKGMFDTDMQKFTANLNVQLFTPCLSRPLGHSFCAVYLI